VQGDLQRAKQSGLTTERIPLEWIRGPEQPCVACGGPAGTSYRGVPIDMLCAADVGFYAAAVKAGMLDSAPLLGLFAREQLGSG
jgi:hypothetical protein